MDKFKRAVQYLIEREKLLFAILSAYLCLEYFILGPFSYVRVLDNLDSFVPRLASLSQSLFSFGFSFWDPLLAGGVDRLANEMVYWNIGSIFFTAHHWIAYVAILFVGVFIGSFYTYKLSRKILQLSQESSVLAGIIFSYFFLLEDIIPFILGLTIVPVVLYYMEVLFSDMFAKRNIKYAYILLLGFVFSLFSSFVFTLIFTSSFILLWFVVIRRRYSLDVFLMLFLFFLPSALIHFAEFQALLINTPMSHRNGNFDYFYQGWANYFTGLVHLVAFNWPGLLLTLYGLLFVKGKQRSHVILIITTLLLLFIMPLYKPLASLYGEYFKFIRNFSLDRFYLLIPMLTALCSAFTLDKLPGTVCLKSVNNDQRERCCTLRMFVVLVVFLLFLVSNLGLKMSRGLVWLKYGSYVANTSSPDVESLASLSIGFSPFRTAVFGSSRFYLADTLPQFYNLETAGGAVNLLSKRYQEFFRIMAKDMTLQTSLSFFADPSDDTIKRIASHKLEEFVNIPLMSLANIRYIASAIPVSSSSFSLLDTSSSNKYYDWSKMSSWQKLVLRMQENFTGRKLLIYENKDVFPRFFLAQKTRVFNNSDELLDSIESASTTTLRNEIFIESDDAVNIEYKIKTADVPGNIKILNYSPDEIGLSVESDGPAWLVISNNYSPYWKATINGKEVHVIPAYHTFMTIFLTDGTSEVTLRYEPPYFIN